MKNLIYWSLLTSAFGAAPQAAAQVTFFEGERFDGRSLTITQQARNFQRSGFDHGMSSAVVLDERWEVLEVPRMDRRCMLLRQGRYASPASMGLSHNVVSARLVPANERIDKAPRLARPPVAIYDARRRNNERLYWVPVISVRAVMDGFDRRCWMEREAVAPPERQGTHVPGAVLGALIGGILGHEVGGGSGQPNEPVQTRNVQRCSTAPASTTPPHWEVAYSFRGQHHMIQTAVPPAGAVTVNRRGEPRT